MSSAAATTIRPPIVRPGQLLDWYPETLSDEEDVFARMLTELVTRKRGHGLRFSKFRRIARRIEHAVSEAGKLDEPAFETEIATLRIELRSRGFVEENLVRAFALVGVEVRRQFGFDLHREQYFCAWILLHGMLAEMATGEGKSITAALAAIVAGLAGTPVHVITTNDYLVARDAAAMRPLFERFGLDSGHASTRQKDDERRAAYSRAICYVSNKQLVFDYLRDRQQLGNRPSSISARVQGLYRLEAPKPLLRGLCFAIVDEADSVLIDDAITPLILSKQAQGESDLSQSLTAISLAHRLTVGDDFKVDTRARRVSITERGEERLASLVGGLDGIWKNRRFRLELVRQALTAIHLYHRDRDYLVRDGEVVLVDQSTGRMMPDRKLQHGLHQMVETKEKCELSGQAETLASLSFQNFFRRYKHICGMTGTAKEAAAELRRVYRLDVVGVPTHRPSARISENPHFAAGDRAHKDLLLTEIRSCRESGRPVLVGTRSLAQSERISDYLNSLSLPHRVLNARQDAQEAEIVSKAGRNGAITIATNIAGRGTDIPLDEDVRGLGGLKVIVAELNDNQRIDRQLLGRCARQGDPGSYAYIISLEDEMLLRYAPKACLRLLCSRALMRMSFWPRLCLLLCRYVQSKHERHQRHTRKLVALADAQMNRRLSFSGYKE